MHHFIGNAGLEDSWAGIKISGRNINHLSYLDVTTLMEKKKKWRGTKEPLNEGERGEWKSWLKAQHSKNEDCGILFHHFIENRWGKVETMTDFLFLGSKITADSDYSYKIERCLLLWRKPMTNLDSILKSRDITLSTKICIVKAMVFPVAMYRYECWTMKRTEHGRTDAFEDGAGEDSWEARGLQGDQTLKEINPEY